MVTALKYRGSIHRWDADDFFPRVSNKGATILLIKLEEGPCIGGFTQASWKKSDNPICISDDSAMIFNLTDNKHYPV